MKLIVGLGNPEARYADTRHNAGWRVVEELAARAGAGPWKAKFDAALAEGLWRGEKVVLARPLTFMNNSGLAARSLADFWKLSLDDLLVVLDDMAIDVGWIRLRREGSAGGHNGLASVIAHLGDDRFARLRVGIGPAPPAEQHVDFVLSTFTKAEQPLIEEAIRRAADAAECWMTEGPDVAMTRFNRGKDD